MVSFLRRDNGRIGGKHKVNSGIWNQIGLELGYVHVQSPVETEARCKGRDHLRDQSVQVSVGWFLNI